MKRWIVNPKLRTVREQSRISNVQAEAFEAPCAGEFLYDAPTYADAMGAGQRRRLAEEALESVHDKRWAESAFTIVGDRIEPRSERTMDAHEQADDLFDVLTDRFDVWREGTGLVVLGRLP